MRFQRFEDMPVWRLARRLTSTIYKISLKGPFRSDFGLRDQMQRSAVSVMSNIAEGYERLSKREFMLYLGYAKGSVGELRSQLYVAYDQGYINEEEFNGIRDLALLISQQLANLLTFLRKA